MAADMNSSRGDVIHESEVERLQKEIDHFTMRLEQERRQSMLVDEHIKRTKFEVN
jgi:hypothetical protein